MAGCWISRGSEGDAEGGAAEAEDLDAGEGPVVGDEGSLVRESWQVKGASVGGELSVLRGLMVSRKLSIDPFYGLRKVEARFGGAVRTRSFHQVREGG